MKQHKHCELIKAWADGAEIQILYGDNDWCDCSNSISWIDNAKYRIKPKEYEMTKDDWKRVIDDGFLVYNSARTDFVAFREEILSYLDTPIKVVRQAGIRQPHFQGDKHPEGCTLVVAKCGGSYDAFYDETHYAGDLDWSEVTEYIVLGD